MYFGWITAVLNALIHVFMYYYYAMNCLGYTIWWRKYLTTCQILQFVVDCATSYPWLFFYLNGYACRGDPKAWVLANIGGCLLIALFMNFYRANYQQKARLNKKAE